ncbi:hypothetical protein PCANC_18476 [Puccinia coronata f. sp. avenae]|uniref:Integrase catalytic domain-containing protein n=1 Tax=Puccinia coronata f. sp. avenae TaxID=200324 RepID=A0A2N5SES1_9BASI|nr:hypothetical protein PCANC_18476 [Puccinia coronata f. sp. avenae]
MQCSPPIKAPPPPHSGATGSKVPPTKKPPTPKVPSVSDNDDGYSTETRAPPHRNYPPPPPSSASNPFQTSGIQTSYEYATNPRNRNSIVKEGSQQFATDDDCLKMDGSNFRAWFREICEFALMSLDDADFYLKDMRRDICDPIARMVILSSINRSFRSPYHDFKYSFEIMRELKQRYVVFSRAGQLNLWDDLLNIKCDESTAAAEVSASFRNTIIDLAEAGLTLTKDNVLGLMLHSSISCGSSLRQELDRRVDQKITGRQRRVLEFSEMVDLLTDCQETVCADNSSKSRAPNPSAFATEGDATRCAPGLGSGVYQHVPTPISNGVQHRLPPLLQPPGYQAHYPVLTPPVPGFPNGAPANQGFLACQQQPGSANTNFHPADYYRPSYNQQAPPAKASAREADLMDYESPPEATLHYSHNLDDAPAKFAVASSSAEHRNHVLFDMGAMHHVTGDRSALTKFEVLTKPIPLKVATNGSSCVITARGTLTFRGPGSTHIPLKGVLFCEHVLHTLVSPVALRLAGFSFTYKCKTDSFLIFYLGTFWTKSTLDVRLRKWFLPPPIRPTCPPVTRLSSLPPSSAVFPSVGAHSSAVPAICLSVVSPQPVYSFNSMPLANDDEPFKVVVPAVSNVPYPRPQLTSNEKILLQCHKRFGHVGLRVIRCMMVKHAALGLPDSLPAGDIVCPSCMISKSVNKNTLTSDRRSFEPMEAWNVDLIGPFETPALGGGLYVLSMRNIGSSYAEIKILTKKNEALELLKDTITRMETFTKRRVKILRSDNDGEFNSKALSAFLASKGIVAERLIAYHHYQNGCVKRFSRTLQDMGRTLLVDSGLPKPYWALAFVWACYTLNRIPNSASGDITPYEKMYGFAPNLDRLQSFGAQAFTHIPAEKRKKLDDRAHLGYAVYYLPNSKGWGFWVPLINDFVESAVATFPDFPSIILPQESFSFVDICNLQLGNFEDELTVQGQDDLVNHIVEFIPEICEAPVPTTFKQVLRSNNKVDWMRAMQEELANLDQLNVWEVRRVPSGKHVLKAKYVAKGFDQIKGEQFDATFAPTATFVSMQIILTIAAANNWPVHTFDFVAAYLNSPIDKEVWVTPPEGLAVQPGDRCLLKKALYGTKQAGRCWWQHLSKTLGALGYSSSQYDASVYILQANRGNTSIWIHVDDGIVTGSLVESLKALERALADSIKIKWSSGLTDIIGLRVDRVAEGFKIHQPKLVSSILKEHWDGVSHATTPLPNTALATTNVSGEAIKPKEYLSIVGSLSYVSSGSRPDITFAVNFLARFLKSPDHNHWKALNHLLNYLAATRDQCLHIFPKADAP